MYGQEASLFGRYTQNGYELPHAVSAPTGKRRVVGKLSSDVISRYLQPIVRAFVRFCIRHSVSYQQIDELLRKEFVFEAQETLREKGLKATASKLHVISGIRRKEIKRILTAGRAHSEELSKATRVGTGLRVIWTWVSAEKYLTTKGTPKILSEVEFYDLVRSVSTDVGPKALLSSFIMQGIVEKTSRGVRPVLASYQQREDWEEVFRFLGADIEDLFIAVEENLQSTHLVPNVHATTEYWNVPLHQADEVRTVLMRESETIHRRLRRFLGKLTNTARAGEKLSRVSFLSFSRVQERNENEQ